MVKIPAKFRRVAAVFDEVARARPAQLCDQSSSGSDHSPEDTADLSDLVESFIEREGKLPETLREGDNKMEKSEKERDKTDLSDDEEDDGDKYEDVKDRLRSLLGSGELEDDSGERRRTMDDVEFACGIIGEREERGLKRKLMTHLRSKGYDAGLCKSRWERFGKNPAGNYEYVDITQTNGHDHRYIVEANLAGEFQIAKPTARYLSLLDVLPRVFVGKPEVLKQVVRLMCLEMRRSIKRVGMHVPPWRSNGYMQAKWFGHYKRTVNEVSGTSRIKGVNGEGVRRWVGFEDLGKTAAFPYSCREEYGKVDGFRIGRLTAAFNGGGTEI